MSHTVRPFLATVVLGLLVAVAVTGCSTPAASTTAATGSTAATTVAPSPEPTPAPLPGAGGLHVSKYKVSGKEHVKVVTERGTFTLAFFPKAAPNTVATFLELASQKFYDGIKFHRVEPGFVVQAGDPQTKDPAADPQLYGTGDPGFHLKAEFNGNKHRTGTLAMARAEDVDSAGSQFYITLSPQPTLDNQYTVFGEVVSGMDVVEKIQAGDTIKSMTIVPAP